jgi:hypothetical protein
MESSETVYEISRFDPAGKRERLIERLELRHRAGSLFFRAADGSEVQCQSNDVEAEIASMPQLHEIYADQITRITASPDALRYLPLLLRTPGDAADFDKTHWSQDMWDEHIEDSRDEQRGVIRVLYVNDLRWGAFATSEGQRLLPDDNVDWDFYDNGEIPELDMWGRVTFGESASMTYGLEIGMVGLATTGVVIVTWEPDQQPNEIRLTRRNDDVETFIDWLLNGGVCNYGSGEARQVLLTQLFVEVAVGGLEGDIAGDYLMAGMDIPELMIGAYESSEWTFDLGLNQSMTEAVLDRIVERGGRPADVVTAAREPNSPPGQARRTALEAFE